MSKTKSNRDFRSGQHYSDVSGRKPLVDSFSAPDYNREWLQDATAILPALNSAEEVRIFSRNSISTAPLVVWTRHANAGRMELLRSSQTRPNSAPAPKAVHDGWMIVVTKHRHYAISYDFYAGALGHGGKTLVVLDPMLRDILCTAHEQTRQLNSF